MLDADQYLTCPTACTVNLKLWWPALYLYDQHYCSPFLYWMVPPPLHFLLTSCPTGMLTLDEATLQAEIFLQYHHEVFIGNHELRHDQHECYWEFGLPIPVTGHGVSKEGDGVYRFRLPVVCLHKGISFWVNSPQHTGSACTVTNGNAFHVLLNEGFWLHQWEASAK